MPDVKYYFSEGAVLRVQDPSYPKPEVFAGGQWQPYPDLYDFLHNAREISPEDAERLMQEPA